MRPTEGIAPARAGKSCSKTNKPVNDVATILKLLSTDAFAGADLASPIMSKIGAAISSAIIPSIYGYSLYVIRFFGLNLLNSSCKHKSRHANDSTQIE